MTVPRLALLSLSLIVACKSPERGLGEASTDQAVLADTPGLAHLADALDDPAAELLDLFDDELSFATAPDPTALFSSQHDAHAALADGTGTTLNVLTFNAGLLGRNYLIFHVEVPQLDARRERTGEELFASGNDILFLQEVWEVDDAERIQAAGEAAGYTVWRPDKRKPQRETGLVMAVRSDLIASEGSFDVVQYDAQRKAENMPGPNLKRGWIQASFTMADTGVEVHLFNTHLTPYYDRSGTRSLQGRQLGLEIAQVPDDALVLVGGDFNAGWYYADDTWVDAEGEEFKGWWLNPILPAVLSHYGGLSDLANLAELVPEVSAGQAVPTGADATWLDTPYGDEAVCDTPNIYTATDCNSHYHSSYAATEYPARMDLLFVRDGTGKMRARSRERAFVEHLDFGEAGSFELSDHFGQQVTIEIVD